MSNLQEFIQQTYQKEIAECSNEELYIALLNYTKLASAQKPVNTGKKEIVLHFSRIFDWKTVVKQPHQPWPL